MCRFGGLRKVCSEMSTVALVPERDSQLDPDYEQLEPESPLDVDDTLKPVSVEKHDITKQQEMVQKSKDMTDESMKKYWLLMLDCTN
jgi:hypothetical protein